MSTGAEFNLPSLNYPPYVVLIVFLEDSDLRVCCLLLVVTVEPYVHFSENLSAQSTVEGRTAAQIHDSDCLSSMCIPASDRITPIGNREMDFLKAGDSQAVHGLTFIPFLSSVWFLET